MTMLVVVFAMSLLATASASAIENQPQFKTINLKLATSSATSVSIENSRGSIFHCYGTSTLTAAITAAKTLESGKLILGECENAGIQCYNKTSAVEGRKFYIESETLVGQPVYLNPYSQKRAGVVLGSQPWSAHGATEKPVFAKFSCRLASIVLTGYLVTEITPTNTSTSAFNLNYTSSGGMQGYHEFHEDGGMRVALHWVENGSEENAGLKGEFKLISLNLFAETALEEIIA